MDDEPKYKPMNREHLMETLEQLAQEQAQSEARERAAVDAAAHHTLAMGLRSLDDMTPSQREFSEHLQERFGGRRYHSPAMAYSNSDAVFSIPTEDREEG